MVEPTKYLTHKFPAYQVVDELGYALVILASFLTVGSYYQSHDGVNLSDQNEARASEVNCVGCLVEELAREGELGHSENLEPCPEQ